MATSDQHGEISKPLRRTRARALEVIRRFHFVMEISHPGSFGFFTWHILGVSLVPLDSSFELIVRFFGILHVTLVIYIVGFYMWALLKV